MIGVAKAGISLVETFIDKFIPDKDEASRLRHAANSQEFEGVVNLALGQIEVNKQEAAHKSAFVAGWRPFVGWVCGFGVGIKFIFLPIVEYMCVIFMTTVPKFPEFNIAELMTLLGGMLGFGALRTYEKLKGVSREK